MAKRLNETAVFNELREGSAFFRDAKRTADTAKKSKTLIEKKPKPPNRKNTNPGEKKEKVDEPMVPRHHDTTIPSNHDTMTPRYHKATIETIRKAVKQIGKEAATHRYTVAEKKVIAGIIFTYKNQGVITSENEISRIAINFIIEDFENNGEESILAKAIKALNE